MDRTESLIQLPLAGCDPHLHFLSSDRCSDDALIELKGVYKTFKNAAGEFTALKGLTTCFHAGEFVSIVGKSGSGKSTLANMLTGIDHPTSGSVRVGDMNIHTLSENAMSKWRGRNLGIVFQFFQLMPILTLLENVMLPMVLADLYRPAERERRALELLSLVGLADLADKLPSAVSGGQQQSAAIARALANDPPIIIADEPTGNLDSRSADEIFDVFTSLVAQGKTILMVTHDISLASRTDRTLLLADGELIHPCVAEALPDLPHNQLLWLTHRLGPGGLQPGEFAPAHLGLALVLGGQIEVLSKAEPSRSLARIGPGEYVSALELGRPGQERLTFRSFGHEPVCLLTLDEPAFSGWLAHDKSVRAALELAARQRLAAWETAANPQGVS